MSTYTPIASQTLSASASSVTFSGIPQTYTDLVMAVVPAQASAGQGDIYIQFNSDGGSNYSATALYGSGSAAGSTKQSNQTGIRPEYYGYPDTVVGKTVQVYHIMNYSNSTTYKTLLSRANSAAQGTDAVVGLWRSTAAITSITLTMNAGASFISGSTFNLYGIDASLSAQAKATGGNSIYTDGTYWYHIFQQSGVFTPSVAISNVDYLVVAGGGGGYVQGGGAGGMRCTVTATGGGGSLESKISLTSGTAYTITVGAGGANGTGGTTGSNSAISGTGLTTITSTGGGGSSGSNGVTGGSGGGAFNSGTAGSGTANQGYAGGAAPTANAGGGGGGAGAVGSAASGSTGGNGGNGVATSITGSSVTYAGGGSGYGTGSSGTAGTGGGGTGGDANNKNGVANTGGGAGGFNAGNGGLGGSGIVIIRYAV